VSGTLRCRGTTAQAIPPEGSRKAVAPYFLPFLLLLFLPFFFAGIVLSLLRGEEIAGRSTPPI